MNRKVNKLPVKKYDLPHARGDEPPVRLELAKGVPIFPTLVGMNRRRVMEKGTRVYLPHARGDEPAG